MGIYRVFNVAMLVFGIIIAVIGLIAGIAIGSGGGVGLLVSSLFIGGFFILAAFLTARRVLRIEHAGGCIAVDMKSFSKAECENFRIALFRAKDEITGYHA